MNLKTIIQKVISWFEGDAKAAEQDAIALAEKIGNEAWELTRDGALKTLFDQPQQDATMSTPAVAPAAPASTNMTVDTAIRIALAAAYPAPTQAA